jgi:hypothetical protein
VTSAVAVAKTRTPEMCRLRSKSAGVPKTPRKTGSVTGVDAVTRVDDVSSSSGWVLTQPITASSTTSTTTYTSTRQPRRDGATASTPAGSGVTEVMAGG